MAKHETLTCFRTVFEAVGTPDFEKELADAMGNVLDFDFITMARYSTREMPRFLIHSHTFPSHMAELYLSEFAASDPYLDHWRRTRKEGVVWLQDFVRDHNRYSHYTGGLMPEIGVTDEIGVFLPGVADSSVAIFFNKKDALFSLEDSQALRGIFDACAALYRLHIRSLLRVSPEHIDSSPSLGYPLRITNSAGSTIWVTNEWSKQEVPEAELECFPLEASFGLPERFLWTLTPKDLSDQPAAQTSTIENWSNQMGLTPREKDIVQLIFKGHSSTNIAHMLDLSLGNIKNHKGRIYRKLGITSERELFLMFFGAMAE
ncbi:helix-turn-helix domain-containing protein [Roseovarius pelagicus]|uniref:LuxR C-terminal-related transcriptional regulator n=1 Tax=Roseovarius pelagicus TaxID=2980108 RepID=A0ABY6D8W3_9RHOB|nr:LuxR family transcriptional regulator [Roseovarius pelagicus]UXX82540.1 LuxR C-terminal-related transcriptional regulator [Roseovarius pelagicus]